MKERSNAIELIGIKKTRPTLSCIRHLTERWIERQQSLLFFPSTSSYQVTIARIRDAPIYTCEIRITVGNAHWGGCESGKTLQDSVERTLRHLHRDGWLDLSKGKVAGVAQEVA